MSGLITSFFKSPPTSSTDAPTTTTSTDGAAVSMAADRNDDDEPLSLASSQCSSDGGGGGGERPPQPLVVNLVGLLGAGNARLLKEEVRRGDGGKKEAHTRRKNGSVLISEHHDSRVKTNGVMEEEENGLQQEATDAAAIAEAGEEEEEEEAVFVDVLLKNEEKKKQKKKHKKKKRKSQGHPSLSQLDAAADVTVPLMQGEERVASVEVTRRRGSGYLVVEECMVVDSDKDVEWLSPLKPSPRKPAGTLSNAWAKIFNKVSLPQQKPHPPTTPPSSPKRSPTTRRRGSPLRPRSARSSPVASPLKKTQTRRQLPFTGPSSSSASSMAQTAIKVPVDSAPFDGLVHVQQKTEPGTSQFWSLAPSSTRLSASGGERQLSSRVEEGSRAGSSEGSSPLGLISNDDSTAARPNWQLPQQLTVVSAAEREQVLADLAQGHSGRDVVELCSLFSSSHHHPSHPHTFKCSIKIQRQRKQNRIRKIKVDSSAYNPSKHQRTTRKAFKKRVKSKSTQLEMEPLPQNPLHSELWTEVCRPKTAGEVLGSQQQVQQLKDWLGRWAEEKDSSSCATSQRSSLTAGRSLRTTVKAAIARDKVEENSSFLDTSGDSDFVSLRRMKQKARVKKCFHGNSSSESEDSDCDEEEEGIPPRAALLMGPHGSGKTAAVYACASELGFKVFEVNSGVVRSRPLLLSTLREATLSHQVAISNGKVAPSNSRPLKVKPPSDLHCFFKSKVGSMSSDQATVTLATKTVILLEEVDVVFEEDKGFWLAVSEIVMATRRPIVLTCSDPRVCPDFPHLRLTLTRPEKADLSLQIRLLGLAASNVLIGQESSNQIAENANCDIRKAINHLQLCTSWLPSNCCQDNKKSCDTTKKSLLRPPFFQVPWKSQFVKQVRTSPSYQELDTLAHTLDSLSELDHMSRGEGHMTEKLWWCSKEECGLSDTLPLTSHDPTAWALMSDITMATDSILNCAHHAPDYRRIEDAIVGHVICPELFSPNSIGAHVAMVTECLPILRLICQCENARESASTKRRYQHYLSASAVAPHTLKHYGQTNLCFAAN